MGGPLLPTLSVVIPCYNEALTIETIVDAVSKSEIEGLEILVVDDYSTDGTRDKLREIQEKRSIEVVLHERNMGKGAALRTGFARATGDIVIVQDADLEYDPRDYPKLVAPILEGEGRCRLRLALRGRRNTSGAVLLALRGKQISDAHVQHVH